MDKVFVEELLFSVTITVSKEKKSQTNSNNNQKTRMGLQCIVALQYISYGIKQYFTMIQVPRGNATRMASIRAILI